MEHRRRRWHVSERQLHSIYLEWLSGRPLRYLARKHNTSHYTLHTRLKRKYGTNATSIKHQSLLRSMLEDYPNNPEVLTMIDELIGKPQDENYYRSLHSLKQLSKYSCATEVALWDTIATEDSQPDTYWEFLRLPYMTVVLDTIVAILSVYLVGSFSIFADDIEMNLLGTDNEQGILQEPSAETI